MPRPLTKCCGEHDDPNSKTHAKDKAEKRERLKVAWEPAPAPVEKKTRLADGISAAPAKGFCFRVRGGSAVLETGAIYTRAALAMSRERARSRRIRIREGREIKDTARARHGAVSLVATTPPWAWPMLKRMRAEERDDLMLRLAESIAAEIREVSGRDLFGGGVHYDGNDPSTFFPHWHLHVPKSAPGKNGEPGPAYPKEKFLNVDDWTANACRISRKFPGLLSEGKERWMRRNLEKKGGRPIIDLRIQERIDRELETWIREKGRWQEYTRDCAAYCADKRKRDAAEAEKRITKAALSHFHTRGVWPLAYRIMTLAVWRMIPRELRAPIQMAIRATQVVRRPTPRRIGALARDVERVLEMTQPSGPKHS
jgi:hypothetical protein